MNLEPIRVGKLVQLARDRQQRDFASGGARGLWFDSRAADRAVNFFKLLRHSKGEWAGKPFELAPWQEHDIVRPLFGWKRTDGSRRFRSAYVSIARKNGKSPLAAGIALYLLAADREAGAEVYSAATKRDQARITFEYATQMVKRSPELRRHIVAYRDSLAVLRAGAAFKPLSADSNTMDGLNASGAVIDELHAHKTRGVWDVLRTATSARRQPLLFAITTAGFDRKTICWEVHDLAVKVLERALDDDSLFVYIATIDASDSWQDEAAWVKANPNLGISKKIDYLRTEFRTAREIPGYQNTFRRLDLNQWTEQSSRAIDMDEWHACAGRVCAEDLRGRPCFAGLDLSSVSDLTALDLEFPLSENGELKFKGLTFFWLPAESIARRSQRDGIHYDVWAEQGILKLTPGNVVDYDVVRADVNDLARQYQIQEIAYDPWNATEIGAKLAGDGFKMVEFRQGFRTMSEATKRFLGLILDHRMEHGANPILTWMASNLAVAQDPAGNLKPDKEKSREKIDGMVAKIMATWRALLASEGSVYDSRGIITI